MAGTEPQAIYKHARATDARWIVSVDTMPGAENEESRFSLPEKMRKMGPDDRWGRRNPAGSRPVCGEQLCFLSHRRRWKKG